jgi:hypothetical protein
MLPLLRVVGWGEYTIGFTPVVNNNNYDEYLQNKIIDV